MTFKQIFDSEAPIDGGIMPIWLIASVATIFAPGFPEASVLVVFTPFVWLMALHWLFRFGKWVEFRIRPKDGPSES